MKKIIATALSILVGVFGYTIADKELSARVDELEASVSSMQEEISSLHAREPATEPESTTTEPDVGTDIPDGFLENIVQIDFNLPDTGDFATITATLDGSTIYTDSQVLDGSDYELTVSGLDPTSLLKVFINEKLYYKCSIDFSTTPCRISNITIYN